MTNQTQKIVEIEIPLPNGRIGKIQANTNFEPTDMMAKWLEKSLEMHESSPSRIAQELKKDGIKTDVHTFFNWQKNTDFLVWWDKMWMNHMIANRYKVLDIAMDRAKNSEPFLIRLLKFFGYSLPVDEEKQMELQAQQNISAPTNTPPVTPTIGSINIIAANIEKSAKERGISLDDSSGESPIVGEKGSEENH